MAKLHQTRRSVYVKILPSRLPCLAGGLCPWSVRKDTFQGKIGVDGRYFVNRVIKHRLSTPISEPLGVFAQFFRASRPQA